MFRYKTTCRISCEPCLFLRSFTFYEDSHYSRYITSYNIHQTCIDTSVKKIPMNIYFVFQHKRKVNQIIWFRVRWSSYRCVIIEVARTWLLTTWNVQKRILSTDKLLVLFWRTYACRYECVLPRTCVGRSCQSGTWAGASNKDGHGFEGCFGRRN